jgi:UDP-GlcNAc3NAcA epimerase
VTKILTVLGARPQFVKASIVSRALEASGVSEIVVHTGQHFDDSMSATFFDQLDLPAPAHHLGVCGGSAGEMTGRMLQALEPLIDREQPTAVLVYGDTTSTLAGALAAAKLHVPVIHVEAGLRSFRRTMPEEINRVLTDHMSSMLCCPTTTAVRNLKREGFENIAWEGALMPADAEVPAVATPAVINVGDVMLDTLRYFLPVAARRSAILERLAVTPRGYAVLTVHRAENTESIERLGELLAGVFEIADDLPIVFPVHPRTAALIRQAGNVDLLRRPRVFAIDPLPYLDFIHLQANARVILTDSGGVQKEALFLGVPCLTLRDETEWPETLRGDGNQLVTPVPSNLRQIVEHLREAPPGASTDAFGDGLAAPRIARLARVCRP